MSVWRRRWLLAQHNAVTAVTTTPAKAENINRGVSPIVDAEITDFLRTKPLTLTATVDAEQAYRTADVVIIATPTDYDPEQQIFNTSTVEAVLSLVGRVNPGALVVIKSTVPVGYTERVVGRFGCERLLFSPEFLREGRALYDNLHPSRIVVGRPRSGTADGGGRAFVCVPAAAGRRRRRTSRRCTRTRRRPRPSSSLPTRISPCA